jgi:hypothetical protein
MDRDTAVARIQQKLGFRSDLVTPIQNALNDAQLELENSQSLPWFLLQEDEPFTITPPSPATATPLQVTLPTGFIKESDDEEGNLRYQQQTPGPSVYIQKMDLKQADIYFFSRRLVWYDDNVEIIQAEDTNFTAGVPIAYVLRKNVVQIYPGPDQVYNLLWSYYTHDQALNGGNLTNQWLTFAPWLVIGRAGMLISADVRDSDAYAAFTAIVYGDMTKGIRGAEKDFLASCYERELGGRVYRMGGRL